MPGSSGAGYLALHAAGELRRRAEAALVRLQRCDLCPRHCAVDRLQDARDTCGVGRLAQLSSVGPHFGEEAPLVGARGSGTVFFSGCNLGCSFCQNHDISHARRGQEVDAGALCAAFLSVQEYGCHNLNLVTPTHVTAQILEALDLAAGRGLTIPVVYNCGGYEALDTLRLLDGVVEIYMPDLKYAADAPGARYSGVPDYRQLPGDALHRRGAVHADLRQRDGSVPALRRRARRRVAGATDHRGRVRGRAAGDAGRGVDPAGRPGACAALALNPRHDVAA